jgi:hypothetical protein
MTKLRVAFCNFANSPRKVKLPLYSPIGVLILMLPKFLDIQHIKVVRLSALATGHLCLQDRSPVLISVTG